MQLHSTAAGAGYSLLNLAAIASTNAEALTLARAGERGPLWITAEQQTAGRGRRGSPWISPPGNLYATLLLHDPAPTEYAAQLSFVAALAVHDAICERAPALSGKLKLKWPNDLLCGGAKIAGILIESERSDERLAAAVGIGVNCRHHPADTPYPATDLTAEGAAVSAESLFTALSRTMLERLNEWHRGAGFTAIRTGWMARAAGIGGDMKVRLPDRELFGRGEALDECGRLLLRLADGTVQTIAAGEVFPLSEPAADRTAMGRTG
jgi:BirA family transcriptional regulator, biotin operon repressor / biotin---[acetyl-CoA-carboxylase] ligase